MFLSHSHVGLSPSNKETMPIRCTDHFHQPLDYGRSEARGRSTPCEDFSVSSSEKPNPPGVHSLAPARRMTVRGRGPHAVPIRTWGRRKQTPENGWASVVFAKRDQARRLPYQFPVALKSARSLSCARDDL